jgi:transposase
MKLPLELVDVLKWRNTGINEKKQEMIETKREVFVDRYINVMYPVCAHMIQFGIDYHEFMDNNNPVGFHSFIEKYKNDKHWRLAKFANGLQMDIDAVKNTLLYPNISNGVVEGINGIIKCIKRVCGGKAKIDLLTAKMILRQLAKTNIEAYNIS